MQIILLKNWINNAHQKDKEREKEKEIKDDEVEYSELAVEQILT